MSGVLGLSAEAMPTSELLLGLLRLVEAEPRRAPDEVVELVRREAERLASARTAGSHNPERTDEEGHMTTIDAWTYRSTIVPGNVIGYDVEAVDGGIGKVSEASAEVGASYVVVDTGPWIFGKTVMLPAIAIDRVDHDDARVLVDRTKDEIKNAPEFDPDRYREDDYRTSLADYYTSRRTGR
jgi:hypothetical protein